jgi:hypothetical protein
VEQEQEDPHTGSPNWKHRVAQVPLLRQNWPVGQGQVALQPTQAPPQQSVSAPQLSPLQTQVPCLQTGVGPLQTVPHAPQLFRSFCRSTQVVLAQQVGRSREQQAASGVPTWQLCGQDSSAQAGPHLAQGAVSWQWAAALVHALAAAVSAPKVVAQNWAQALFGVHVFFGGGLVALARS